MLLLLALLALFGLGVGSLWLVALALSDPVVFTLTVVALAVLGYGHYHLARWSARKRPERQLAETVAQAEAAAAWSVEAYERRRRDQPPDRLPPA